MSLVAEISDLIKDLHISADAAPSSSNGLSSAGGGVGACILILVCTVL